MAGSTAEVARTVGEEITRSGLQINVLPIHSSFLQAPPHGDALAYDWRLMQPRAIKHSTSVSRRVSAAAEDKSFLAVKGVRSLTSI
ncbi:MAG TPA: hypothetical protein VF823_03750 [Anaerolineales bacterium]